jgi:DNA-binding response OmpR family regulator
MKVLLIDERPDALEFLGESIVNFGYKTGVAKDKTEIVPMLSDDQYEVVLTNGGGRDIDIDQYIRAKYPSVFIVQMTLSHKKEEKEHNGVDLYLRRPFEISKLRSVIRTPLRH